MNIRSSHLLILIAIAAFTIGYSASTTVAQNRRNDLDSVHRERLEDPAAKNTSTQPVVSPPAQFNFGNFQSVQVNVDANGNNIVGDAANEPSIAMNPLNNENMVIGWRQFDSITSNFRQAGVASTVDGGSTWNNNGPIDAGVFRSDPVLAADSKGRIFYYSLSTTSNFDAFFCDMFISEDGGLTWGAPIPARGGDKQWMTIDKSGGRGDGYIYAMWNPSFSCCPEGYFTRSVDNGQNYLLPIDSPAPIIWGTLDVGPDGELYICGASTFSDFGVIRSDDAQLSGVMPTFPQAVPVELGTLRFGEGPNPGGLLGQFDVGTDHSNTPNRGNVYFLGSVQMAENDPLDIAFSRSTDGGLTWSKAVRINTDNQAPGKYNWFGTMSVAPCGRIDVIWNDMRDDTDGTMSALY